MACNDSGFVNPRMPSPVAVAQDEKVVRLDLRKGAVVENHKHESEVMVIVVNGALRFYLPHKTVTISQNQMLRIPAGMEHRAEALADTLALNISAPLAERNCCGTFLHHDPDQYLWGV